LNLLQVIKNCRNKSLSRCPYSLLYRFYRTLFLLILLAHSCPTSVSIDNLNEKFERDSLFGLKSNVQQIHAKYYNSVQIFITECATSMTNNSLPDYSNQCGINIDFMKRLISSSIFCVSSFSLLFHFDFSSSVSWFFSTFL